MKKMALGIFVIIAAAAFSANAVTVDMCLDQLPQNKCWTAKDVIDERIDSHAQKALIQMFTSKDAQQTEAASAILCGVKRGDLEGIYLEDQKNPALRARDAGYGWWKILQGEQSVCYKVPDNRAPIIVLSKKIQTQTDVVAQLLKTSWPTCNLPSSGRRCYAQTAGMAEEKREIECVLDRDCVEKHQSEEYECDKIRQVCVYKFGMDITPGPCTGQGECKMDRDCESNNCARPDKNKCGRCRNFKSEKLCATGDFRGDCVEGIVFDLSCEASIGSIAKKAAEEKLNVKIAERKKAIQQQHENKIIDFFISGRRSLPPRKTVEKEYETGDPEGLGPSKMRRILIEQTECAILDYDVH